MILESLGDNRTLVVFDGYDENPIKIVNKLIQHKQFDAIGKQHPFRAKILVTARGTHAPIPARNADESKSYNEDHLLKCNLWLRILGFNELSIKNFLKTQLNKTEIETITNLYNETHEILSNPLYATMAVGLDLLRKLSELEQQVRIKALFDGFLHFHRKVCKEKIKPFNETDYNDSLIEVGRFAMFQLCTTSHEFSHSCNSPQIFKYYVSNTSMLIKYGLVISESKLELELSQAKSKLSFYHHSFLEYFAAFWLTYDTNNVKEFNIDIRNNFIPELFRYFALSANLQLLKEGYFMHRNHDDIPLMYPAGYNMREIYACLNRTEKVTFVEWNLNDAITETMASIFQVIIFEKSKFISLCNASSFLQHRPRPLYKAKIIYVKEMYIFEEFLEILGRIDSLEWLGIFPGSKHYYLDSNITMRKIQYEDAISLRQPQHLTTSKSWKQNSLFKNLTKLSIGGVFDWLIACYFTAFFESLQYFEVRWSKEVWEYLPNATNLQVLKLVLDEQDDTYWYTEQKDEAISKLFKMRLHELILYDRSRAMSFGRTWSSFVNSTLSKSLKKFNIFIWSNIDAIHYAVKLLDNCKALEAFKIRFENTSVGTLRQLSELSEKEIGILKNVEARLGINFAFEIDDDLYPAGKRFSVVEFENYIASN